MTDDLAFNDFICPTTGDLNCMLCTGEACDLCGAGCWDNSAKDCEHDVLDRHIPGYLISRPPTAS